MVTNFTKTILINEPHLLSMTKQPTLYFIPRILSVQNETHFTYLCSHLLNLARKKVNMYGRHPSEDQTHFPVIMINQITYFMLGKYHFVIDYYNAN